MAFKNSYLVYSTQHGKICPSCNQPITACLCRPKLPQKSDGIVRISRETKGRKGKGVTLIRGLSLDENSLKKLATELKTKCGAGGAIKGGVIEIQGDHRDFLLQELKQQGWTVKCAGG